MTNGTIELGSRSIVIIVFTILLSSAFGGIFAGGFGRVGVFDEGIGKCQKKCEVLHPGTDADSVSKKLNCQLACY